ncbi:MAG: hypothetical protein ACKOCN_02110 [Planctomycetaceae bacterium]
MTDRHEALDRYYSLLEELAQRCGGPRRLAECDGSMDWPERGVYFFFEAGETRAATDRPRVVRVGTHALRPSRATLWSRLAQHRGQVGGSMPGGGNHRGSIFRLHVGTALLATGDWDDEIRRTWGAGSAAPAHIRKAESPLERAVTAHIGAMPLLWLGVGDPPGPTSDRGLIEAGSIALLSNAYRAPIDPPSADWLGRRADRDAVRQSGLWNVNHVYDPPQSAFLKAIERHVARV